MHPRGLGSLCLALAAAVLAGGVPPTLRAAQPAAAPLLHVPSPDWRDQVIYFVMTDRFDDGDPANNDQGASEFDPASNAKYSGGDLVGIERHLDYIRGLGATAIWITPPVAHQWWNVRAQYGGYHGYWGEDFSAVDPHYGTLADYKRLSGSIHAAGMYLVQDIVVNHVANFIAYDGQWSAADPAANFRLIPDANGRTAPTQWPFTLNDVRNPEHRKTGVYHWTPDITDFTNPVQERTYQLAGLDDLNTENPVVRDVLRESYGYWIREVGVDAFRVDTAFYVPSEYFTDFLHSNDAKHPGILQVAENTGRKAFHVFGEGFGIDKPYDDAQARKIDDYMRGRGGEALLPGMLNFPLYGTAVDVFARGRPTAELAHRIRSMMAVHAQPHLMPSFIDNHDVDRFLASGNVAGLKQGLLLLMTLPGIPVVYYGTEQGFTEQRGAMFKDGYGAAGRDHFDTDAPLYQFIKRAIALRRAHLLFSRGTPTILRDNAASAGVLAYRMRTQVHGRDESALVVFNTSDHAALLDNLDTGLAAGTKLQGLFAIDGVPEDLVAGADGLVSLRLPARSGMVWKPTSKTAAIPARSASLAIEPLTAARVGGDFRVRGNAKDTFEFLLVVDGNLDAAQRVRPDADDRWEATVDTGAMADAVVEHNLVAWDESSGVASARCSFRVERDWKVLAEIDDPAGDDAGPDGRYRYPSDAGWGANRQADIRGVRVSGAGGALKIDLRMHEVTASWNPSNGFDHVAFTIFVQVPGQADGATVMPLQNATLPHDMRWHYRLRAHGWSNALFSANGASATNEGTATMPAATIAADRDNDVVSFLLSGASLGNPKSLAGAKVYVTTWDYDGGYRPLVPTAQSHGFGGGDGNVDPLVMDAAVIALP
ncbi:alpha-amylase family glycosyl hydrolase [Lysobacter sp. CFH 32150]|uniref:alpha-amylase family glycosyl hydrolase n=1 Tax=Lysobacter sp. CFH 32150 TaxID=2927128 RepID=UPI001FA7BFDD|nr:alpha-amylase family glycosyl hydrolase [Lysobacter sp. CFH 32150]MCI4566810.1 alpha-amylase family glycosyl hydrolase [Lysobacter sp. CFH 32150]